MTMQIAYGGIDKTKSPFKSRDSNDLLKSMKHLSPVDYCTCGCCIMSGDDPNEGRRISITAENDESVDEVN